MPSAPIVVGLAVCKLMMILFLLILRSLKNNISIGTRVPRWAMLIVLLLSLQTGTCGLLFFSQKFYDICDPAEENEPNTLAVKVTTAMTPHDVMIIILNGN